MENRNEENALDSKGILSSSLRRLFRFSWKKVVLVLLTMLAVALLFALQTGKSFSRFVRNAITENISKREVKVNLVMPSAARETLSFFLMIVCLLILCGVMIIVFRSLIKRTSEFKYQHSLDFNFGQIGGLYDAKRELGEIADYFKNSEELAEQGIKRPGNIIIFGPPGNGKTMLAKSFAHECGVPFIFQSDSGFHGALSAVARAEMSSLFRKASSFQKGCVVFIDEIDMIGRKRSISKFQHEEVLNQLLRELDNLSPRGRVFVLAATNAIEELDHALLRTGRFDRKIRIGKPTLAERREIIAIKSRNKDFASDVDFGEIALVTEGFSGAQVSEIVEESLLLATRQSEKTIGYQFLLEAVDRILLGPVSSNKLEARTAYHEVGHLIVALTMPAITARRITIVGHSDFSSYTFVTSSNNECSEPMLSKNAILARIMSLIGGKVSEELFFGCTGPSFASDISRINELLDQFIIKFGMSRLGIISSEYLAKETITNERKRIIAECTKKVESIMKDKIELLDLFVRLLLEKGTIERENILYIFANKISPYSKLLAQTKG